MNRQQWETLSAVERRALADPSTTCIESGCTEPAGTPWGPLWCADHDDARIHRISVNLNEIAAAFREGQQ